MLKIFKHFKNTLLTSVLVLAGTTTFWDFFMSGNSLLLFGEPEYPSED